MHDLFERIYDFIDDIINFCTTYYEQDKWKSLLENRLPSIAKKMNIKYEKRAKSPFFYNKTNITATFSSFL